MRLSAGWEEAFFDACIPCILLHRLLTDNKGMINLLCISNPDNRISKKAGLSYALQVIQENRSAASPCRSSALLKMVFEGNQRNLAVCWPKGRPTCWIVRQMRGNNPTVSCGGGKKRRPKRPVHQQHRPPGRWPHRR